MENITDALKMAAAMMIFAGAITITIFVFTKAREASTAIMAQYDKNKTYYNLDGTNITGERKVGVDIVISNLYSYFQTQNTIVFFTGSLDSNGNLDDSSIRRMPLYRTLADETTLEKSSLTLDGTKNSNEIFGLDINDEAIRGEQWINGENRRKRFVDLLVTRDNDALNWMRNPDNKNKEGNLFTTSKDRVIEFTYSFSGTTSLLDLGSSKKKFIERIGEYNSDLETSEKVDNTTGQVARSSEGDIIGQFNGLVTDSSVIRFSDSDEVVDNSKGDKKKIIEYIYIGNQE